VYMVVVRIPCAEAVRLTRLGIVSSNLSDVFDWPVQSYFASIGD
jgi:hypothetical protein